MKGLPTQIGKIEVVRVEPDMCSVRIGEQLQIDLRMIEVASGVVIKAAEQITAAADISGWLKTAEDAAVKLM